ncbi:hypothetical protein ACF1BS_01550 [Streptomyces sp. NPDC014748]|uniref:hypothetical protein n=1 Tax=Streptomyces sp. NPDC014748 TaxID=3364905 RepID=UPI0036FF7124
MPFVTYSPGRGTVRETAYLEGRAEGRAESILRLLEARGLPVPGGVRERVATCTDLALFNAWLDRVLTVARAEDLFAEGADVPG